ncbi:Acb2/Tad1 domain-containing protein [Paraburkholderia sediminicola]|uniref:Acb2/Tad1 domain-containing protein n=1 Tax=Paraburkholderia sediminicola TaxID=458836 RepID=UPI0038BB65DC
MDNQHKKIKGYRDLSQADIDLMNRIKAHAEETRALVEAVREVVTPVLPLIKSMPGEPGELVEGCAIYAGHDAGPWRWICLADDHLQQGYMALTRAVAQPTTY